MIHVEMANIYLVSADYIDGAIFGIDCVDCVDRANRCRWRHGKWQVVTSCDTFDFHSISQCANNAYKWSVNSRFNPNKWRNVRPALVIGVEKHFSSTFLHSWSRWSLQKDLHRFDTGDPTYDGTYESRRATDFRVRIALIIRDPETSNHRNPMQAEDGILIMHANGWSRVAR